MLTLLIYVPAFLVTLAIFGNPFRVLFERYSRKSGHEFDRVQQVALTFAMGSAILPLIVMLFSIAGNALNVSTARASTAVFILVNVFLYLRKVTSWKSNTVIKGSGVIAALIFASIFIWHLLPSLGLFVHPGCDHELYTLISLRITESGGFTNSWGLFAEQSWYQETMHLYMAGFGGICAFFNLLTGLSVDKAVFLITLIYTSLIAFGVYFLTKTLFRRVGYALCAAFIFGMLVQEPGTFWFGWGGHAELSSLFLLPIVIGLMWQVLQNDDNADYIPYLVLTSAGMFFLHPFSVFYLFSCLVPFSIVFVYKKRRLMPVLKVLASLSLAILIISPQVIKVVANEVSITNEFSESTNPAWSAIVTWNQTLQGLLYNVTWRIGAVYGFSFILFLICLNEIRNRKINKEPLLLLGLWVVALFLLHENNPTGLYVVRFPLWYRVDPNRIFTITSFGLAIVTGAGMFEVLHPLTSDSFRNGGRISAAFKYVFSHKKAILILAVCALQLSLNTFALFDRRQMSPVTSADMKAFDWITQNTSTSNVFFVTYRDAGTWVPFFARRQVVMPFGVVTNLTLLHYYEDYIIPTFINEPNNLDCLNFLSHCNVSHVYVGSKAIYGWHNFNQDLLAHSPLYELVYNESNVHIFRYRGFTPQTMFFEDKFLEGWDVEAALGSSVDATTDGNIYRLGTANGVGYVRATHSLNINGSQDITYLRIKWKTSGTAKYKIEVVIDGQTYIILDRIASQDWTVSTTVLDEYAVGKITSINILVDGDGFGMTDFIEFIQTIPIEEKP